MNTIFQSSTIEQDRITKQEEFYTPEEWFDELDKRLLKHFGEEYRQLANERRSRWNEQGPWKFDTL